MFCHEGLKQNGTWLTNLSPAEQSAVLWSRQVQDLRCFLSRTEYCKRQETYEAETAEEIRKENKD